MNSGSVREGRRTMERERLSKRRQLDGERGTPKVFSPSYPSGWQGRPLTRKHTHPIHLCSERRMRRRRRVCRSTMSDASPTSPLAGSAPQCGRPSGWHLRACLSWFPSQVGLLPTDLFDITGPDDAARNAKRFERIWEEEKQRCKHNSQKPSLSRSLGLSSKCFSSNPTESSPVKAISQSKNLSMEDFLK